VTTTDISLALLLGPQLRAFRDAGYDVVGVSAPGPFKREIEEFGVRYFPMRHATRGRSLVSDGMAMAELYRILRQLEPDIVHTHNPKPGVYGRIAAAVGRVPAVVNTVHGLYASRDDRLTKRTAVYALERFAASFSDAELVQNPEDFDTLARLRVPRHRLRLLGNGIDLERFSPKPDHADRRIRLRREFGASDETVVITAIGRLVWEKGYREIFEAAQRVRRHFPDALFVVAGPTEPTKADGVRPEELAAMEASGLRYLGHRADVESIYAASDVFVLASHREGFPRAAMEAAAMGLPIVATDIRGCRQVVSDGKNGLLVPPRDPDALAQAISSLVADPAARARMGGEGAKKARSEFDQKRVIEITLQTYQELLARNRRLRR
jgi:glycosyltransferase involved in cell wall biosynthesis